MGLIEPMVYKLWSWKNTLYKTKSLLNSDIVPPANATETTIDWDKEDFDVGNMTEYTTNPERLTIKKDGVYLFVGAIYYQTSANPGFGQIKMYDNGGGVVDYALGYSAAAEDLKVVAFGMGKYSKNDYVYLRYYQNCNFGKILKAYTWFGAFLVA